MYSLEIKPHIQQLKRNFVTLLQIQICILLVLKIGLDLLRFRRILSRFQTTVGCLNPPSPSPHTPHRVFRKYCNSSGAAAATAAMAEAGPQKGGFPTSIAGLKAKRSPRPGFHGAGASCTGTQEVSVYGC